MQKKYLPYLPAFALVIGISMIQIHAGFTPGGVLSNSLNNTEVETPWYCAKPDAFTENGGTPWCVGSDVAHIEKKKNTWTWQCQKDTETRDCRYEETVNYPTRGGVLFGK